MSCKWKLCVSLMTAIAGSLASPSFAQYQGYPATPAYNSPLPQRAQLPLGEVTLPPVSRTQPYSPSNQTALPHAYSPSQMPSVNPFADVRSRQQQLPVNNGRSPYATDSQYQPAPQNYYTFPASTGDPQQSAIGGGLPHAAPDYSAPGNASPAPEMMPTPQSNSYYDHPAQDYWSQPGNGIDPKGVGCSTLAAAPCHSGWYGGVFGMVMTRSNTNNLWLSYDTADIHRRLLNSNDAGFSTAGGSGASIGHYFNCGQNSIQFVYWGLYPGVSEANAYGANATGQLDRILHFDGLQYNAGTGPLDLGDTFFFNAERHRVQRNYQLNNIELNLLGHNFCTSCCPLKLGWTAGVRYLNFNENFLYSSDVVDTVFTGDPEEVHYAIDVNNNLIGLQLGGQANYCVGPRLGLFANTKVGLYGNHMSQQSRIFGSNGLAFVGDPVSPYVNEDVNATSSKNGYSMIGDLSIGANWCINPCWSINVGYRAVGITGVALSTNQVPGDFIAALDSIRTVNSNGCVLLHGAFAGINYCY